MTNNYETTLNWALENGLFLDDRVERKKVDGVYGMYAKEDIPQGTVFASFPAENMIPINDVHGYTDEVPPGVRVVHATAVERAKGEDSKYYGCFGMFESLDDLKGISVLYFDEDDHKALQEMNPVIAYLVSQLQTSMKQGIAAVKQLDPSLDEDIITETLLNKISRAWPQGFLPVLDLFNHSDTKGSAIKNIDGRWAHESRVDYKKGDQIFITYGYQDMVRVASGYSFFDPTGLHFIDYALRAAQVINSQFKQRLFEILAQKYKLGFSQGEGVINVQIHEPGLFFTDNGPTTKLVEFFKGISIINEQDLQQGKVDRQTMRNNMSGAIEAFLSANKVDQIKLEDLQPKLQRFYHMLKKEKTMLEANKQWIEQNL